MKLELSVAYCVCIRAVHNTVIVTWSHLISYRGRLGKWQMATKLCLRCYISTVSELYCAYCASVYFIFTWLFGHFGRKVDD